MNYIAHVTAEGDTWDRLAYRYYGNARRYPAIIEANPHVPITAALQAGITLAIPLLSPENTLEDLPPWKR